jgi:hypothetical protein
MKRLGTWTCVDLNDPRTHGACHWDPFHATVNPTTGKVTYPESAPDTGSRCPVGPPDPSSPYQECQTAPYSATYGNFPPLTGPGAEDWAQTFAAYIYPQWISSQQRGLSSTDIRYKYVVEKINEIR